MSKKLDELVNKIFPLLSDEKEHSEDEMLTYDRCASRLKEALRSGELFAPITADGGGLAFPGYGMNEGMTRRQWLAGMAMQAIVQANFVQGRAVQKAEKDSIPFVCEQAYDIADGMIEHEKIVK